MKRLTMMCAALLGCAVCGLASAAPRSGMPPELTGVQCVECHDAESRTHVYHSDCATCHVDAKVHAEHERPRTLKVSLPETQQCLTCHVQDSRRMNFTFAEHNRAGVQCSDCHGNHTPKIKTLNAGMERAGKDVALCATCHQDVMARLSLPSHHPVKEGGLSCTNCHDPHAGKQVTLASKTDQCLTCHQRQRGPQAFEHAPVVEDCTTCHDPHGTPNRRLLTLAQPMLCLQCHSLPNNRHGQTGSNALAQIGQPISGAVLRNCVSCHGAVHGSSQDEHLRF